MKGTIVGMTRRSLGTAVGTTTGAAALAACDLGRGPGAAATPSLAPVTLRYAGGALGTPGSGTYGDGRRLIIEALNARGGPAKVESEAPSPLNTAVLAQAAAGDPPDLVHAHPREYHPFVNTGAILGLDAYMKKDRRNVPEILPTVLEYWSRDGQRWAMPNNWSLQGIYFNNSLFDKQGLKTPDQHEREGKWTFDVYLDLARKLTTGAGETKTWGAPWTTTALDIQLAFFWPFGGDLWDKALQNTLLDTKESLEAIQFQGDLTAKYGVAPTDAEVAQVQGGVNTLISAGRSGMDITTTDSLGRYVTATFAVGMAPMPKGRAGRVIRGAPLGVHLLKGAKHHDAAWEFANFQSGQEAARIMLDLHVTLPWHKSQAAAPEKAMKLLPWESAAFYAETIRRARPTVYPAQFREIVNLYTPAYRAVRHGEKTAQQAIAEIKPQINELLRQR
ncbi:MAG: sugar ABC transporter substrate-binding protein [Chloroflexi bacterium]|nr:sugar ABC transporter substrate-binding protein [Chloroflexota bacterium]